MNEYRIQTPDLSLGYIAEARNYSDRQNKEAEIEHQRQLEKQELTTKEVDMMNGATQAAVRLGVLPQDDYTKYTAGNLSKKREVFNLAQMLLADKVRKEETFSPSDEQVRQAAAAGYQWMQQSNRGGSYVPLQNKIKSVGKPSVFDAGNGIQVVDDGTGHRTVIRPGTEKPMNSSDAMMAGGWQQELAKTDQELNEHTTAIANGDKRYGFMELDKREDKVKELMAKRQGLSAKIEAVQRGRSGGDQNSQDQPSGGMPVQQRAAIPGGLPQAVNDPLATTSLPQPAGTPTGPMVVKSQADYDNLPIGTRFTSAADGKSYVKK